MARRRKTSRRRHRTVRASLAKRPWLVRLCVGVGGFLIMLYAIGPLLGVSIQPHADPLGDAFHADVLLPLAWLWLLVWAGAALASAARGRNGRRGHGRTRSRRRRSHSRRKQAAPASPPAKAEPEQPADPAPAAAAGATPSLARVNRENIAALSAAQFEHLVATSFQRKGFEVEFIPEQAREGIDFVLRERDKVLRVQCRHDRDAQVGEDAAHALQGLVQAQAGGKAILATSGRLTPAAHAFCRDHAIHALDIDRLLLFADPAAMPAVMGRPRQSVEAGGTAATSAV
ncbi:MAG: hypothetical protein CMN27_12705 [Salinisphaera sp.]|nr:hypothetical protein [Salinisphaera sp.]